MYTSLYSNIIITNIAYIMTAIQNMISLLSKKANKIINMYNNNELDLKNVCFIKQGRNYIKDYITMLSVKQFIKCILLL